MRQPAAALMSIIVPRIVGGLGTGEPRTQLAGRVESKSPRPSFGGRCVGLFCPARARRARRHKAANPYRLDFSCTALKVAPRVSSVSFCQFIPSPPALSPTHSWYSSCRIVDSLAVANKSSSCLFCSALALTAFAM
jgi:hypothetical protein